MDFYRKHSFSFLFLVMAAVLALVIPDQGDADRISTRKVTVVQGDTLLSLHAQTDTTLPADRWMEEVLKLNSKADTTLRAGETIVVPALPAYSDGILLAGEEK
ncbi:hypothetical protein [Bhargavaea cecembensis]|uniref:hypothetical protein n=1 Tax=Bhargavaea cecembensis TaxID=394098 RepID=UPI00058D406C|nr:hypothetical protein [Bhargavaea cecembensis]